MAVTERERRFPRLTERLSLLLSPDNRIKIMRVGMVLGVLLLSAVMGQFAVGQTKQLVGLGAIGLVLVVVFMLIFSEHLDWSLMLLMVTATFTPFSLPTGTASRIADSMVVAGMFTVLWVLRMFIVERRFRLVRTPANIPLLGFMLASVISLIWSIVFRDPEVYVWSSFPFVQMGMTAIMILLPASYLLVANFGNRPALLKVMTWMLVAAGPLGLAMNFTGISLPVNVGGLFAMWVMALSLSLAFFQPGLGWLLRLLLLVQVAGWVVWSFVLHISWVAGWLPGLFAAAVLLLMRSRKLFLIGLLVVLLVVVIFNGYFMERLAMERAESGDSRLAAWQVNWRVTGAHILFGTGPGGYAAYYMTYYPTEAMATHNNYVDVIAQTGVVGLVFWLWFFAAAAWQGFRLVLRLRGRWDFYEALANAAFAGTLACILIMMFGDWLLPFAYTNTIAGFDYAVYSWIFMGTIVAIDRLIPADNPAGQA